MANNREISQFAGLVAVNDSTNAVTIGSTLHVSGDLVAPIGAGAGTTTNVSGDLTLTGGNVNVVGIVTASDVQTTTINSGQLAGFKNYIINGDVRIWQRGTSISASYASRPYTADHIRMYNVVSGSSSTHSRSTDVPSSEFEYSLQVDNVGKSEVNLPIELDAAGSYAPFTAGGVYTFSYWAKGSNANWLNTLGARWSSSLTSGTLVSDTLIKGHTGGGGWERVIHRITLDAAPGGSATYLSLLIGRNQAFTGTAYFTGFQLERGPVATEFEHRPIGTELALCQRYYQRIWGTGGGFRAAIGQSPSQHQLRIPATNLLYTKLRAGTTITFESSGATLIEGNSQSSITSTAFGTNTITGDFSLTLYTSGSTIVSGDLAAIRLSDTSSYIAFDAEI